MLGRDFAVNLLPLGWVVGVTSTDTAGCHKSSLCIHVTFGNNIVSLTVTNANELLIENASCYDVS